MREKLVEITPEVEAVLIAARCEGERLTLQGQLDRALYVQVDKVWDEYALRVACGATEDGVTT